MQLSFSLNVLRYFYGIFPKVCFPAWGYARNTEEGRQRLNNTILWIEETF